MNQSDAETPQLDQSPLVTEQGRTTISPEIVAKLAAIATREIDGVYRLAGGTGFTDFTQRIGSSKAIEGVQAEVGLRETAIDLRLITAYGASIPDVAHAVRQNVIARVTAATGLSVKEVNIEVVDLHFPDEGKPGTHTDALSDTPAATDETGTNSQETVRL
jgi:uncharacterized alkaline shock family protein YloU